MPNRTHNVIIAGLGGQGVLTASDLLAFTAFLAGYDVKKAEVHGMSQRGGSVTSDVRFGDRVLSPMVPPGEADFLVVLEETQAEPNRRLLRPGGVLLNCAAVDTAALPTPKALNVAMLGMLSAFLAIPENVWKESIAEWLPERLQAMNVQAFGLGRALGAKEETSDVRILE